jgi:hypothetical protein
MATRRRTDQDRIEGVSECLGHGTEAAKIGLGLTSMTRLENRNYLAQRGRFAEDCPTCQALRSYMRMRSATCTPHIAVHTSDPIDRAGVPVVFQARRTGQDIGG